MTKPELYSNVNSVIHDHTTWVNVRAELNKYFDELDTTINNNSSNDSTASIGQADQMDRVETEK